MRQRALGAVQKVSPMLLADWREVLFIHYAIPAPLLQPMVPFELDLWEGRAFVSLVAFTQRRLRPRVGGRIGQLMSSPLAEHEFLNLRTYVRLGEDRGVYFLAEWVPNRLAVLLGPLLYGLPYRLAKLRYSSDGARGFAAGEVSAGAFRFAFEAAFDPFGLQGPARCGSLDEFLVERYVAFTSRGSTLRRFKISHAPWPQVLARVRISERSLIDASGRVPAVDVAVAANYSPGVADVEIGPPERIERTS